MKSLDICLNERPLLKMLSTFWSMKPLDIFVKEGLAAETVFQYCKHATTGYFGWETTVGDGVLTYSTWAWNHWIFSLFKMPCYHLEEWTHWIFLMRDHCSRSCVKISKRETTAYFQQETTLGDGILTVERETTGYFHCSRRHFSIWRHDTDFF